MEALYGAEQAAHAGVAGARRARRGTAHARRRVSPATRSTSPDTADDPDSGLSGIAYTKGSAFLRMLEAELGRARLDAYLRGYFDRHAFTSLTTPEFPPTCARTCSRPRRARSSGAARVASGCIEPGLPANATPVALGRRFERVLADGAAFVEDGDADPRAHGRLVHQRVAEVPRRDARHAVLASGWQRSTQAFRLSEKTNSEVLFAWLRLAALRQYDPAVPAMERFLLGQGRRKFVYPLFEALLKSEWGAPVARRLYERARGTYHPVTVILGWTP